MVSSTATIPGQDLSTLIKGRYVTYAGRLASMGHDDFVEIVEAHGGRYAPSGKLGRGVAVLVIGEEGWPLTKAGTLAAPLRQARILKRKENVKTKVLSEEQFLAGLGLEDHRENLQRYHTTGMLVELLEVSRERINAWVKAGLIRPAYEQSGVRYFDFRQVSAAKTLCELARSGVTTARLRKSLEQLKTWMPDAAEQPLQQLAVLESDGRLLVRLEEGELAEPDGQFQFDFAEAPAPLPMRIGTDPRTAAEWVAQGQAQEQAGYLVEAADSYRQALLAGGPDAAVCFDLAYVLSRAGQKEQALERYRQAVETDPNFLDAWNNLGALLAEVGKRDEACVAFRKALVVDPHNARAHYNLADTLDEMRLWKEAAEHWRAYLSSDGTSDWAQHARARLAAAR
jgi:tetratricopeptide (TPR) repeat protein